MDRPEASEEFVYIQIVLIITMNCNCTMYV
jgi:hypothetical protein